MLSFLIFFSNSIEIRNHVKPFRPGTSFRSIHDVKHFSIFVQINVINAKFLIICHLVRRHRLWKYKNNFPLILYLFLRKKSTRDQPGTKIVIQNLSILRLVFNYIIYRTNCCHFIVLQHVRGLKISKRENNINQFIAISENYWTRDQAGTKIMSVGFLCYFNKMYFYYMLEIF